MKLLNIDWWQFLNGLEMYRKLLPGGRRIFIEQVRPSQPISKKILGSWCVKLVESGLMVLGQTEVNAQVRPEHREFSRAVRAMSRAKIFIAPTRESFLDYLNDNLTGTEAASLDGTPYYGRMGYADLQKTFSNVCSPGWIKQFLAAKSPDWERDYADPAQPRYFSSSEIFSAAQQIVHGVSAEEGPLPIDRLPAFCGNMLPEVFSGAMRGLLRYLLLFTAIRADDLEPVAGIWPGVSDRILNKPVQPPQPVKINESFHSTFLMDDMTVILAACAAEPLRIRSGDMQIFEADYKSLVASLGSLPAWFEQAFQADNDHRISYAVEFLRLFSFVERAVKQGSGYRLVVTGEGSAWLAKQAKDRLRFLFDVFRGTETSTHHVPMVPGLLSMGSNADREKIAPAVLNAYAELPEGVFLRLGEFVNYQARSNNVLSALSGNNRQFSLIPGRSWGVSASEEELDTAWQNLLSGFLKLRLAQLGGAKLGIEPGSKNICFSVTAAGRYLLGGSAHFDISGDEAARILVQPNFDVVFLVPSARLEAELARFCERKGHHVGTLFRITKSSILTAAAAGMVPEQALELLRRNSPADLPANVASEISGWFRRFRAISVRPSVIAHCPDEATATTFMVAMGKNATRLTPTVLELHEAKIPPAIAKKLRETGIFIRSH
jgi:hypothetical protein